MGAANTSGHGRPAIALHGGATDFAGVPAARRQAFGAEATALLAAILHAARDALDAGAAALDVAEAAVRAMEDSGVLNAGRGATRNRDGDVQLDAAVMRGADGHAGAVAAVRHLRNPVSAARLVMERSPHVLLVGADAERFAVGLGAQPAGSDWFRASSGERAPADGDTVGAVVLDRHGDLAAATSTGGLSGKLPGRVGDSPLIGAGTYAENATAAVSATGQGEYFMRLVLAHDVAARMRYAGQGLAEAARRAVADRLAPSGGRGGLIALDRHGNVALELHAAYMPRAALTADGAITIAFEAPSL